MKQKHIEILDTKQLSQVVNTGALCNINDLEISIINGANFNPATIFTVTSSAPDSSTIGAFNEFTYFGGNQVNNWSPDVINGHYENPLHQNRFIEYYVQGSLGGCYSPIDTIVVEQYYSPIERPVVLADGAAKSTFVVCSSDPVVDLKPEAMTPFVRYEWYDADDYDASYPNVSPIAQVFDSTTYSLKLMSI